jgi:hypothetical protein
MQGKKHHVQMMFSLPTIMLGATQNPENVERINLVTLSFSLHCIPTFLICLGKNSLVVGQNWQCQQGRPTPHGAILTKLII